MHIMNASSRPDKEVKTLIHFASKRLRKILPKDKYSKLEIRVTDIKDTYRGRAWGSRPYRVLIRIGLDDKFPAKEVGYNWKYKTAPSYDMNTWQEALIIIAAHEFYHIIQFEKNYKRSEIAAEKKGVLPVLKRFRISQV